MKLTKEIMIEHARKHNLFIHPDVVKNWDEWIKKTIALGRCPCSYRRPVCPCPESVEECHKGKRGACCCTTFVTQKYIDLYAKKLGFKQEDFYKPE